ncbi:MAG: lipocalin family protein [Methylococcaceae bacterium]
MNKIKKRHPRYKKQGGSKKHLIIATFLVVAFGISIWFFLEMSYLKPAGEWFETNVSDESLVSLPKDDAPHQAQMEWWYYNGHLTAESGQQFSFHYTVFLVNGLTTHLVSHVSLSDYQNHQHHIDQHRTTGFPTNNTVDRFDFVSGDWIMKGGDGVDQLKVVSNNFSFNLNLISTLPPVLHGKNGIISLDQAGSSYYYSRTRMVISGLLKIGKKLQAVKGTAWFDHQWGDFSTAHLSWDWFSLQLDDGADVMVYQLRDKANKPILYTGTITQNGVTELLPNTDFTVTPGTKWLSKKTGIAYPVEWNIKIPARNIAITTKAIVHNSEFDASLTTYNVYWEGAVKVQGSHTGLGFMELSGYTAVKH